MSVEATQCRLDSSAAVLGRRTRGMVRAGVSCAVLGEGHGKLGLGGGVSARRGAGVACRVGRAVGHRGAGPKEEEKRKGKEEKKRKRENEEKEN
jgi:hypothetical protein